MSKPDTIVYLDIVCRVAPNGGWILTHPGRDQFTDKLIGAFSDGNALIEHLKNHITEHGFVEEQKPAYWTSGEPS